MRASQARMARSPEDARARRAARDDEATARDDEATARDEEATARDEEATARDDEATARDDEATARDEEATARISGASGRNDRTTARAADAPVPIVLDRYRLQRRLGAGAFGTVWLARDERLERPVAVKILPRERVIGGASSARRGPRPGWPTPES